MASETFAAALRRRGGCLPGPRILPAVLDGIREDGVEWMRALHAPPGEPSWDPWLPLDARSPFAAFPPWEPGVRLLVAHADAEVGHVVSVVDAADPAAVMLERLRTADRIRRGLGGAVLFAAYLPTP